MHEFTVSPEHSRRFQPRPARLRGRALGSMCLYIALCTSLYVLLALYFCIAGDI
ncbi:MAG: hypothetical protein ACRYGK_00785 [Janthinobacterium lividum]